MVNPWVERVPYALAAVRPLRRGQGWIVRDEAGQALPLEIQDGKGWILAAVSGGRPIALSGEWNGESLAPVGAWAEGRFLAL
jgi:hypothetical protein